MFPSWKNYNTLLERVKSCSSIWTAWNVSLSQRAGDLQNMLEWFIIFAAKHFLRLSLRWFLWVGVMGLMPRQMSWQLAG